MWNFQFANQHIDPHKTELFFVDSAGKTSRTASDFRIIRGRQFPHCIVHAVCAGQGLLEFQGKIYRLKAGQLFLLPPFVAHRYESVPTDPLVLDWLVFGGGKSGEAFTQLVNELGPLVDGSVASALRSALDHLLGYFVGLAQTGNCLTDGIIMFRTLDYREVSKQVYAMLLELNLHREGLGQLPLAGTAETLPGSHPALMPTQLHAVLNHIQSHLGDDLSVNFLASLACQSPAHFAKQFRNHCGLPPAQYIQRLRISAVRQALGNPDLSLAQIAEATGFATLSHLVRIFRQQTGQTPGRFRQQTLALLRPTVIPKATAQVSP